jgi:mycothiol synthase
MSSSLLELRHPAQDDVARVAELLVAFEEHMLGESEWSLEELERDWRDADLDRDVWMVLDGEQVVGYVALAKRNEVWEFDGYVHPDRFGEGIGALLVQHGEREVAARASRVSRTAVLGNDERAQELLSARGFEVVRRFYRMTIELDAPPESPAWPEGLTVEPFDFESGHEAVHVAIDEAFAEHWDTFSRPHDEWVVRQRERGVEPWNWIVVRDGDEIAAVTQLERERFGMGWIGVVGVRAAWRRRGLGEAMLYEAFGRFWAIGQHTVGLGVDAQNETGATRLYERAGMGVAFSAVVFEKAL